MTLSKATKVAIRVSLALVLSMVVATLLNLPHVLWVFFVATSTAGGSLGLSVKRSLDRALMTVVGSLVGGGIHLLIRDFLWVDELLFVFSLFFAIYFLSYSYTTFLFFMAIFFVSIIGIREAFSLDALVMRIVDTLVGAGCGLIASLVVFPMRASNLLRSHLIDLIEGCHRRFSALTEAFLTQKCDLKRVQELEEGARKRFTEARSALNEQKYERIFGNFYPRNGGLMLTQLEHLTAIEKGLAYTVCKKTSVLALNRTREEIEAFIEEVEALFQEAKGALREKRKGRLMEGADEIRKRILLKVLTLIPPDREHMRDWLNYHTFLYYLYRIETQLRELIT